MSKRSVPTTCAAVAFALMTVPAAHAQQWLVNSVIQNQIVETAICDSALKKHETLPDVCAKYPKYAAGATARSAAPAASKAAAASAKFSPVAGDDSLQKLADSLGSDAQERQQMLQLVNAGKQLFEQKYAGKGWTDNVAGAFAFFIVATSTVYTDKEPSAAAQDNLFAALETTLAQSPDLAKASAGEKTALYNSLAACAGLSLLFYVDGKQQGNAAEIGKAKEMAAGFSRKLLNLEPQALAAML